MAMPEPSEGHRRLGQLVGEWEGEETMHPSEWDPNGGSAVGRNRNRLDLGGFAVVSDYSQERDGQVTFTGHGVYTFSAESGQYLLHWFDCLGTPPEVFVGGFEGDILTLAHGGPGRHARMTSDCSADGLMRAKMEMSPVSAGVTLRTGG